MYQKISAKTDNENSFLLILDAGGFSAGLGKVNLIKTEYLLKGFNMLNYSAINLGYRDFLYGTIIMKEVEKKLQIPFVSSNIYDPESNKPFTRRYIIKNLHNKNKTREIKIGIIGLSAQNSNLIPRHRRQGGTLLEARDPIKHAREMVSFLKDKVDVIICLAHMRIQQTAKLAEKVPELDVIILGNDFRNQEKVAKNGRTRIVSAGRQGKYIGDLFLQFDGNNKIVNHVHKAVALDEKYKDDPELANLSASYKKEITTQVQGSKVPGSRSKLK